MKSMKQLLALTMFFTFAAACDDAPPAQPAAPSKAGEGLKILTQGTENAGTPTQPVETQPAPTEPPPSANTDEVSEIAYAYSPIGKRDPFRSLFDQLRKDETTQQLTELQLFELDQLKLVAIVSRIATPYAMVEDPNGKGHTLTRGTLIGKNWGRVSEINPACVVVKEEYRDYTGRKVTNKPSLCLPKPDELKLD